MENDTEKSLEFETAHCIDIGTEVIKDTLYPEGSSDSIILHHLFQRIRHASDLLKSHLSGWVAVMLSDSRKCYDINLRSAPYKVEKRNIMVDKFLNKPNGEAQKPEDFVSDVPDCILTLDSRSLQEIASGNLNPQLAMLAGKIRVEGKSNLAVYLFNLIAPRERA